MENQHRKIAGYRELDQSEIDLMNEIKAQGVALGELVAKLRDSKPPPEMKDAPGPFPDQRWVSIGATHLQEGLMALTRSIAKPTFF